VYHVAWGCLPWSRVCSFSLRALVFTFVASPCTNHSPFVPRLRVSFLVDSVSCPRVHHVFFLRCIALGLQHCTCSVVGASAVCGVSSLSSFRRVFPCRVDFVGPSVVSQQSSITCRSQCSLHCPLVASFLESSHCTFSGLTFCSPRLSCLLLGQGSDSNTQSAAVLRALCLCIFGLTLLVVLLHVPS